MFPYTICRYSFFLKLFVLRAAVTLARRWGRGMNDKHLLNGELNCCTGRTGGTFLGLEMYISWWIKNQIMFAINTWMKHLNNDAIYVYVYSISLWCDDYAGVLSMLRGPWVHYCLFSVCVLMCVNMKPMAALWTAANAAPIAICAYIMLGRRRGPIKKGSHSEFVCTCECVCVYFVSVYCGTLDAFCQFIFRGQAN